jgi:soluble lytic murein transglycosylase
MTVSAYLLSLWLNGVPLAAGKAVGTVLPTAPAAALSPAKPTTNETMAAARERYMQGDSMRVIALLTPHLAHQPKRVTRSQSRAHMMLGLAHRNHENWNQAASHFWWVRTSEHPLAPFAAWFEAEAELRRGRPKDSIKICEILRETWPENPKSDECLLLMGDAWAEAGDAARSAHGFDKWMATHKGSARTEAIRLRAALARAMVDPGGAIPQLKRLSLDHHFHSTAVSADSTLATLAERGLNTSLPTGPRTEMRRIESALRCGRLDVAWEGFIALAEQSTDDPRTQRWIEQNEVRVAKRSRQWAKLAELYERQYQSKKDGHIAWRTFGAWSRAGEWTKAVAWGRKGLSAHGGRGRWASAKDDVAWAEIHLGDFQAAAERWSAMANNGSKFGRNAQFYTAFSKYRSGDFSGATRGFERVIAGGRGWKAKGHYWRAKARRALGDIAGAESDEAAATAADRTGWYTALLAGEPAPKKEVTENWMTRDGAFLERPAVVLPSFVEPRATAKTAVGLAGKDGPRTAQKARTFGWNRLVWPMEPPTLKAHEYKAPSMTRIAGTIPDGYTASPWFDEATASERFQSFSEANTDRWPDLPAAHDLAMAGLVSEAANIVGAAYTSWKRNGRNARATSGAKGGRVTGSLNDWRQFFALCRDHYNSARSAIGLDTQVEKAADVLSAQRLAYPIVAGPTLWDLGERFGVDPLLMMSIMRQESTYRHAIKSHAGAIGLVQVMPATGARLAWMMADQSYSPGALKIPAVNLRYGTYYLSMLIERFDGVYPMAIASYNGGPHNVSRWYKSHRGRIDLDEWAEQIQWRETREYVMKVVGHYAKYTDLYGPDGARVWLPDRPAGDDAQVIDF